MAAPEVLRAVSSTDPISQEEVSGLIARACPIEGFRGRRVLLIVPDATRTAPIDVFFRALHARLGACCARFDVMVALGTHPPMSEAAICARLGIDEAERRGKYRDVALLNHDWQSAAELTTVGTLSAAEIDALTGGRFAVEVPVRVNRRLFDYDRLIIVGPVFPHEVVGFSGGNKYLFPGVSGPEILNFFHWLGAVVTNPMIIGHRRTPVRRIVDRAAEMVGLPKLCFCLVVGGRGLAGVFAGSPEAAWEEASDLSRQLHITYKERAFHTIVSCAPAMYEELWVAGKCMYKLEPVLADGGELIIYAPHLSEISTTHGATIEAIGYHCRDYFLRQWDRFKELPWGTLAHSTHVRGIGTYQDGLERCRARVTLATAIPPEVCARINLGYRDPALIRPEDYANRENDGVLLVPNAGEMLFQLRHPAEWSRPLGPAPVTS